MAIEYKSGGSKVGKPSSYDKHLQGEQGIAHTTIIKEKTSHGEKHATTVKDESETVHPGVVAPEAELCKIAVGGNRTINLGNFESAKISVSLTMPCTKETLEETYTFVTEWISDKLDKAIGQSKE
jgi:hypothetical protein